jgi:hypothetical protein
MFYPTIEKIGIACSIKDHWSYRFIIEQACYNIGSLIIDLLRKFEF